MKTAIIRLRLADALGNWRERVRTRLHHRLVLADTLSGPSKRGVSRGRPRIPVVAARNAVIDNYPRFSTLEIVRRLDFELTGRDGFVLGLPKSWRKHRGVTSYKAAYEDKHCRRRLASMISKRRHISHLP